MSEKKCFKCNQVKPLTDFYKHSQMKDGRVNKCKVCNKKDVKVNTEKKMQDPEWAFKEAERHRLKSKRQRDSGDYGKGRSCAKYRDLNPMKAKAHNASQRIEVGEGLERHHWSYKEEHWKDIFPLSKSDHMKIHRYSKYDPDTLQYRTVHNTLLDSRELCEKYYEIVLSLKDGEYSELKKLF